MKFAVAFMYQNESAWLKLNLPVLCKANIDGIVAVDGGSTDDGAEYIKSLGGEVFHRAWDWKPCDQENYVIQMAEECGYDAMLLTAPDELFFPAHIDHMRVMLESGDHFALSFPTFNFVRDRLHYAPLWPYYPDVHVRAWMLGQGVRHVNAIDSVPNIPSVAVTHVPSHMYHYTNIKPRDFYTLKGHNFHRVKDGLPPLDKLPEGTPLAGYPFSVPFNQAQPLDPHEIGIYAPYSHEGELS